MVLKKGGKRIGAGRPKSEREPTKTIAFRVPISVIPDVKVLVNNYLEKFKVKKVW